MNGTELIVGSLILVASGYALGIVVGYTVGDADGRDKAAREIMKRHREAIERKVAK